MALKDDTPLALKLPQLSTLDQDKIVFSYDEAADLLVVHFFGRAREAEIAPGSKWVDLRVDPKTNEIVGLQIEGYLSDAIYDEPRLLELAKPAGIVSAEIEQRLLRRALAEALQGALLSA